MVDIHSEEYKLGQNIRKYRQAKGWSQMDLSNAVDIDRTDISKYENGSKGEMGFINSTYNHLTDANKEMVDRMASALLLQQNMTA